MNTEHPTLLRRLSLGTLLSGLNVALLLVLLSLFSAVTFALAAQLLDRQARSRVEQGAERAALIVARAVDETRADARLLAERPTLQRLIDSGQSSELAVFLSDFCSGAELDAALVLWGQTTLAAAGSFTSMTDLIGEAGLLRRQQDVWLFGSAAFTSDRDIRIVTLRRLSAERLVRISSDVGLELSLIAPDDAALTPLTAARDRDAYRAARALNGSDGRPLALIVARLAHTDAAAPLGGLALTLSGLVVVAGLAGAAINLYAGRQLGRPLRRLAAAAAGLGAGDLARRIPSARSSELATLAGALEHARVQLQRLTEDLRRREAEQAAVLQGISDGVIAVDHQRRIRYLNPQAAALLAIDPAAAVGRFCGDVLQPQSVDGSRPCEQNCPLVSARSRPTSRAVEHLRQPDGSLRSVVLTAAAPGAEVQVQIIRDETEQETGRRLRDTILATISHEFRTPLTAQLASIELLLEQLDDLPAEQVRSLVLTLQRSTLRLTRLVDNLLESARVEAGRLAMRRTAVDLDAVIEDACEQLRPLLEQRRQYVSLDLPYPLPQLNGDPQRLTQVFVNLIVNAHKFSPAGSPISISAAASTDRITVTVHDCGPGSPLLSNGTPAAPFVRALGDEPDQSGTGLGLWISQSIIERHGGTIRAEHRADGTRVMVELPVQR
jgi:signal transduction histidine kinase/HAMP domain-containing protein